MTDEEILARLMTAVPSGNIYWTDEDQAGQLLPAVRQLLAEELRSAAADLESVEEQYHLNYLADHVYQPGDCLTAIWLRRRADDGATRPLNRD